MATAIAPEDGRKLATVERVVSVRPIANADAIDVATVRGWDVVVKKNEVTPGELVVYFEIDSFLPIEEPAYAFLRASSLKTLADGTRGYRLKTVKLRGQISQGLCLPLAALPSVPFERHVEGADVTALLNVRKFEPGVFGPDAVGARTFPTDIVPRTSEKRLQNIGNGQLREWAVRATPFYVTEKLDGTSFTAFWHKQTFGVCSRNQLLPQPSADETPPIYWQVARRYQLPDKLPQLGDGIALQGEIVGPKVQKNRYALSQLTLFVFSVYYTDRKRYATLDEMIDVASFLGASTVPVVSKTRRLHVEQDTVRSLVAAADGVSLLNKKTKREGVVFRFVNNDNGERLGFKCISNGYLLKQKD